LLSSPSGCARGGRESSADNVTKEVWCVSTALRHNRGVPGSHHGPLTDPADPRDHAARLLDRIWVGYFAVLLIDFGLWISYGTATHIPLVVPNCVAFIVMCCTIIIVLDKR
jgi:hypothetical protein